MIKLLSLFSGIGGFEKGLDELDMEYELVNFCEFDKYASKSYCAVHNVDKSKNLGDITKVNEKELPKDIDLITYGFPCQDISLAGRQKGFQDEEGNITRSGLFFEALRIIEETQPKYAIAENVKNLVSKKFSKEFSIVLKSLEEAGYNNYWQILNAKDYGIPQNRERVFIVSIRKDIDDRSFKFPEPFELKLRLKDMLEDKVDEKYYLSEKAIQGRLHTNYEKYKLEKNIINNKDIHPTILARYDGAPTLFVDNEPKIKVIGNYSPSNHDASRIVDTNGIAPTVKENHGTVTAISVNTEPKVIGGVGEKKSNGGRQFYQQDRIYDGDRTAISVTPTARPYYDDKHLRIRKLTPKECWRLMGFDDIDVDCARIAGISNAQLYKQAGNSVCVSVVKNILSQLFKED